MNGSYDPVLAKDTTKPAATRLYIHLIGTFRVHDGEGRSLMPARSKAAALLCLIATSRSQMILRPRAASILWSGKRKDLAAQNLRQALSELQFALSVTDRPPLLATKHGHLLLDREGVWIDAFNRMEDREGFDPRHPDWALCTDLRGLDPALDIYLDRLWEEFELRRALRPDPSFNEFKSLPVSPRLVHEPGRRAVLGSQDNDGPVDPAAPSGTTLDGKSIEGLDRFPQAFPASADIPSHQLGWRMAVLPFRSLGAPLGYGIALGMAEEITAALARFRAPRLIATATFWDGTGQAADALGRCRTYQLDYIVDGTIQVIGDRVRVNVTLLDVVLNFEVIWSARFEGALDDLFSLQDRIASETVAQIDPELYQRRAALASTSRTKIAAAHHAVLTAIQGIYRLDQPRFMRARELLARAVELDPDCAAAHAWMAYWGIMAVSQRWSDDPHTVIKLAGESAERAMLLDPLDARAVAIAGHVRGYLFHDVRSAVSLHARAIELNPNLPIAWSLSSWSKIYDGDHSAAVRHATMAQALSPRDPHIFTVEHVLMTAHFFRRDLEDADMMAEMVLESHPDHASALNVYLAILGHMGRHKEAAHYLGLLRATEPNVTVSSIVARPPLRPEDLAFYKEGLIQAGVPL